jgi:GTPase SAR1 family protein
MSVDRSVSIREEAASAHTLALTLVSHTNIGKTTLARTLLGRDVGVVRDATHVTEFADAHPLVVTPEGERLMLWDTPGFGDSVRLARRMRQSGTPLGWLLGQVWDRWRDRAFWASQQALRNVRDEADVALYLVSAAESPEAAGYVEPEMELLTWTGLPVIVLLNQLGAPDDPARQQTELGRWRTHLQGVPSVRAVLPLDAFSRCWVQELVLLREIEQVLPEARRPLMARLRAAGRQERLHRLDASARLLAASLARLAAMVQPVEDSGGWRGLVRQVGGALGLAREAQTPLRQASRDLLARLDSEVRASTSDLLHLHALEGHAQAEEILVQVGEAFDHQARVAPVPAAIVGGLVSGALAGLGADLATGGLSLGGGMIAGGLMGALGGAGLAQGLNLVRGRDGSRLTWQPQALEALLAHGLLRYLAIAHFGRGRGEWCTPASPVAWHTAVEAALASRRAALDEAWTERDDAEATAGRLQVLIEAVLREVLIFLHPDVAQELADPGQPS